MSKLIRVITDSSYDNQEGVRNGYFGKQNWIKDMIESMAMDGWILKQRVPNECMIFEKDS